MRKEFITPQIVLEMLRQENETVAARAAWTQEKQNDNRENWTITLQSVESAYKYAYGKNAYKYAYGKENVQFCFKKVGNYNRYKIRQLQQSWPWQGCDYPTGIYNIHKHVVQAKDKTSVETVQAKH